MIKENHILFFIRRTRNWYQNRTPEKKKNRVVPLSVTRFVAEKNDLFAKVLGKSILELKGELSEICDCHNRSHKVDSIYNYAYFSLPRDHRCWVFPIDEDDLIDQKSLDLIRNYDGEHNAIAWRTWIINKQNVVAASDGVGVPSNSYAIRSPFADGNHRLIMKHGYFRKKMGNQIFRSNSLSGLKVQSPVSIGRLREIRSSDALAERIEVFTKIDSSILPGNLRSTFTEIQNLFS
jgi:hypothetical protein